MSENSDEREMLRRQQHFLAEIEQGVRTANLDIIHKQIPKLDRDAFLRLAVVVARFRAACVEAALKLARSPAHDPGLSVAVQTLKGHREIYEEARHAFDALHRAIERGYVDIDPGT